MLRAVPSMILIAASRDVALRSGSFVLAIVSTCARVTWPILVLLGWPEPFSTPAAWRSRNDAGGVLVMNVYVRSEYTVITTGMMVHEGLAAAGLLQRVHGVEARVLQMASVKPIDREAILLAARETGRIVTVEEHTVLGGMGGAVAEIVSEAGCGKVRRLGINDRFCGVGSAACLMQAEGLTVENIVGTARSMVCDRS